MPGILSGRPVRHQAGQIFDFRALTGLNVEAARAHAGEEAARIIETEQFSEAESGIEMVPGTGGDNFCRSSRLPWLSAEM